MSDIENKNVNAETPAPAEPAIPAVPADAKPEEPKTEDIKAAAEAGAQVEEAKAENAEAASQAEMVSEVDKMEQESIHQLQVMREANNEENKEIVDEAEKKIKEIFADLRQWVKTNAEPERLKENLHNAAEQTKVILDTTKQKVLEIADSEDFKKAVSGVKDFLDGTGSLIAEGLTYGKEQLCKNPKVKDVFDSVDAGIDKLRENPTLHSAVEKAQEFTENVTSGLFSGLKSFFDGQPKTAPAPAEEKPEEAPAEPEVKPAEPETAAPEAKEE